MADAISIQAANNSVEAVMLNGRRFDCGSVKGYLDAIIHVASHDGLMFKSYEKASKRRSNLDLARFCKA